MSNNTTNNTNGSKDKLDIYAKGEDRSRRKSQTKEPIFHKNKVINHFAECIHAMNEAVLVPSKLQDLDVDDHLFDISPKTDLQQYFLMLNTVRDDLFNGYTFTEDRDLNNGSKYDRQLSLETLNSLSNFPILSGKIAPIVANDVEMDEQEFDEKVYQLTGTLMEHLQSLYAILKQFSKAAQYITKRYQQELDVSSR